MEKFRECEKAASSVVGVVLLAGMTVVMVSTIALSVLAFEPPKPAPEARIVAGEVKGGLASLGGDGAKFKENTIHLMHKGGDSLDLKNLKLIIRGMGQSHRQFNNNKYVPPENPHIGNVEVIYLNLTSYGKDKIFNYTTHNKLTIKDGLWTAGEEMLLSGDDGGDSHDNESSVWVSVNGDGDTSNNYGFKVGEKIYIQVIDTVTNQIISTTFATVKKA